MKFKYFIFLLFILFTFSCDEWNQLCTSTSMNSTDLATDEWISSTSLCYYYGWCFPPSQEPTLIELSSFLMKSSVATITCKDSIYNIVFHLD